MPSISIGGWYFKSESGPRYKIPDIEPYDVWYISMSPLTKRPDEYDLFVSYAHSDDRDGWVSGLVEGIRQEHAQFTPRPLAVFFDRQDIRTMDDWEHRILHGF